MSGASTPLTQALGDGALVPRRELKALMRRSDRPGLVRLAAWIATLCATGALVWAAPGWWVVPAMFLHGIVMVHHFALTHECSHYTAFRTRWLNTVLGHIAGFLVIVPLKFFRYEHCDHHTWTNLKGKDPELIELPVSPGRYLLYLSAMPYWWSQYGGVIRRALGRLTAEELRFIPKSETRAVILESRLYLAGYIAIVAAVAAGWTAPLWYWWLPLLLGEPVMRFIRMTEHVGRPQVADMRQNTRTNVVSAPWRFLAWNMNYHAEHHYAASVPFHALPALHAKVREHVTVEPHGYASAHLDILRAMRAARGA
jgi:fatty acid desaturase